MWKQYVKGPTVIKFGTDWCSTCREVDVVLKALKEQYGKQIHFVSIDADTCEQELINQLNINQLPALYVFKDAELKETCLSGVKEYCEKFWKERGKDYYTEEDVEKMCQEKGKTMEDFRAFISGQTCPIYDWESPSMCYFAGDVERFFKC